MDKNKPKITALCGPTASGKTALAAKLAKIIGAEVISADSMQIYKELNIGTAKPTKDEMMGVGHHLIDVASIKSGPFSVARYVELADECALGLLAQNKRVIVCGGTGLYIDHFIDGTQFAERGDPAYRDELCQLSGEELHSMLAAVDKKSSEAIHPNNKKRLARALEIFRATGKTKSELDETSKREHSPYDFVKFGLCIERGALYGRIGARVDHMMAAGLLAEAQNLYESGCGGDVKRCGAIGYVELMDYFDGLCGLEEAVEKIKQHTRNYAKRQITWFKRDPKTVWLDPGGDCIKECMDIIDL